MRKCASRRTRGVHASASSLPPAPRRARAADAPDEMRVRKVLGDDVRDDRGIKVVLETPAVPRL